LCSVRPDAGRIQERPGSGHDLVDDGIGDADRAVRDGDARAGSELVLLRFQGGFNGPHGRDSADCGVGGGQTGVVAVNGAFRKDHALLTVRALGDGDHAVADGDVRPDLHAAKLGSRCRGDADATGRIIQAGSGDCGDLDAAEFGRGGSGERVSACGNKGIANSLFGRDMIVIRGRDAS